MKFIRWKQRKDADLDAEIQHNLDEAIRDRIAHGEVIARQLRLFGERMNHVGGL